VAEFSLVVATGLVVAKLISCTLLLPFSVSLLWFIWLRLVFKVAERSMARPKAWVGGTWRSLMFLPFRLYVIDQSPNGQLCAQDYSRI
jgi:hypothetical protein